ncbi:MAG: hypothetical protein U9Q70_05710, partial [Chloroflexota bacterium]|nr:hypothetical protein [Chloroflexota bacterium]
MHLRLKQLLRTPLFWLAVLYLVTGLAYAGVTPALEKPDEQDHYGYLKYLREHHKIPPLAPDQQWLFESKQPPLYYVTAAILTGWLKDPLQIEQLTVPNPYMDFSVPGYRNDNRNVFLHPPQLTSVILGARLVSLLFGLGTVLTTYFLVTQLVTEDTLFPLLVAALVGFQPKFIYLATALNNDVALTFFSTLTIALLIYRHSNTATAQLDVFLGITLGLAALTKVNALVLFPLTVFALLLMRQGFRPGFFKEALLILSIAFLIGGWWYLRNAILYHDPLTLNAHLADYHVTRTFWGRLSADLQGIERTFWGNQARTFVSPIWLDKVAIWWGRISLSLLLVELIRHATAYLTNKKLWILASWAGTFFMLLITYWTRRASWAFGRFLLPSIAPLMFFLLWGWYKLAPPRINKLLLWLSAGTMISIGILVPVVSLYPLYHPSQVWREPEIQYPAHISYQTADTAEPIVKLRGYNLPSAYSHPGAYAEVELCWEPIAQTNSPYAEFLHLLAVDSSSSQSPKIWGARQTYPGLGNRPTDRWKIGQVFCDRLLIKVDETIPTPWGVALEIGFINPETEERLIPTTELGNPIPLATFKGPAIIAPDSIPDSTLDTDPHYLLDNRIALNGLTFSQMENTLIVTATWQCLQTLPYAATVFANVQDTAGENISQLDRQPWNGRYPTSYWLPGQIITDTLELALLPGTSPRQLH